MPNFSYRSVFFLHICQANFLLQPDYSVPYIPEAEAPATDASGAYIGAALCVAAHPDRRPPVPYGEQNITEALYFEDGFKEVVGYLTEGRHLVFEKAGFALTNDGKASHLTVSRATPDHRSPKQRWVIHYSSGEESQLFKVSSALDGKWVGPHGRLLPATDSAGAVELKITFMGNGRGYSIGPADFHPHGVLDIHPKSGHLSLNFDHDLLEGIKIFSVTYHD